MVSLSEGLKLLGPEIDKLWQEVRVAQELAGEAHRQLEELRGGLRAQAAAAVLAEMEPLKGEVRAMAGSAMGAKAAQPDAPGKLPEGEPRASRSEVEADPCAEMAALRAELAELRSAPMAEIRGMVDALVMERVKAAAWEAAEQAAEKAVQPLRDEVRAGAGDPLGPELGALRADLQAAMGDLEAQRVAAARLSEQLADTKRLSEAAQAAAVWAADAAAGAADAAVDASRATRSDQAYFIVDQLRQQVDQAQLADEQLRRRVDQCRADAVGAGQTREDLELAQELPLRARPDGGAGQQAVEP